MKHRFVFVCGFPSSGTELLKSVMRAHPDVWLGEEFPFLPDLARRYGPEMLPGKAARLAKDLRRLDIYGHLTGDLAGAPSGLKGGGVQSFADVYGRMLSNVPAVWLGNKTPQYSEHLPVIKAVFPEARVVFIIRDVRDVALSWQRKWGKSRLWCAHKWCERMLGARRDLQRHFSTTSLTITYERLLVAFEGVAHELCEFLDLPFDQRMLEFNKHEDTVIDGKANYGRELLVSNRGKWRDALSKRILRRIEGIAFPAMEVFGYEPEVARAHQPLRAHEHGRARLNDAFALVAVGNRAVRRNRLRYRLTAIRVEIRKVLFRSVNRLWSWEGGSRVTGSGTLRLPSQMFVAWMFMRRAETMEQYFGYDLHIFTAAARWRWLRPLEYVAKGVRTLWLLAVRQPDVVWVQLAPTPLLYVAALYVKFIRRHAGIIADCHNSMFRRPWIRFPWSVSLLNRCDAVVVHNDKVREYALSAGITRGLLHVLEERPATQLAMDGAPRDSRTTTVVCPCSFGDDEPIEAILQAAAGVPEAQFVITGRVDRARGRHDISRASENVRFSGYLPRGQFDRLLQQATVVLGLTTLEGVQLSVAGEAVGVGRPLVLSDTEVLRRLYYAGTVFVDPRDPESIAAGVRSAVERVDELTSDIIALRQDREVRWQGQAEPILRGLGGEHRA